MSTQPFIVVVGTDYSKHADRALRVAYEQARNYAPAELHVVHVSLAEGSDGLASPLPYGGLGAIPVLSLDEQRAILVQHLDKLIAELPGFPEAQVRIFAHVLLDAPTFGVTRMASDLQANMIVVGSHGRHGVARWLLGSVAESVVRQSTCPVLVVPPEAASLSAPQIEPACPACVEARRASSGGEMWCAQHREHHGRRHTYFQADRVGSETNFPLVVR